MGSSGGGAGTISSGESIVNTIGIELKKITRRNINLAIVVAALIIFPKGFDFASIDDEAVLWILN